MAAAVLDDICAEVEVSGPGFINLTLSDELRGRPGGGAVGRRAAGRRPGRRPETVVIDYSSPNVAKEMHVGHLRSTVIGDALARVLGFLGHDVLRENHIGDWGTPFGMLIEHLLDVDGAANAESFSVRDLNEFYAAARRQFDSDPDFAERCRHRVVLLQSGDAETLRLWRIFVAETLRHTDEVYELLGVLLTDDDVVGESFYNPLLPVVVDELDAKGLLVENDGALCVFPEGFENRNGEPLPLIVRKSDGGYGYPATDLASIRDRTGRLGATRLVYVVGAEQSLHLRLVFAVAALAGYLPRRRRAVHVGFGLVLGTDGKKLASRAGGSERLIDLLTEGVDRAAAAMAERPSDLSPERQAAVARALGHRRGQVRRPVDRAHARTTSSTGTGCWPSRATPAPTCSTRTPASARSSGGPGWPHRHRVRRRCSASPRSAPWPCSCSASRAAVEATAETYSPAKLCTYLFDLASSFTTFYEACRVLVDDEAVRDSRLGAVRPDGPGAGARALPAGHGGARPDVTDVTGPRPGRPLSSARHVMRARARGPTMGTHEGVEAIWI